MHFSVHQSPCLSILCYTQPLCLPFSTCLRAEDRKRSLLLSTTGLASFVQRSQEGDSKFCAGRHSLCPFSTVALAANIYQLLRILLGWLAGWMDGWLDGWVGRSWDPHCRRGTSEIIALFMWLKRSMVAPQPNHRKAYQPTRCPLL